MAWAGWGAGPAGAGASGGPSRWFLVAGLVAAVVCAAILASRHAWLSAFAAAVIAGYYAARLFGLGRRA